MTDEGLGVPDGWTDGTVGANGIEIHYVRTGGDGPPLVVAHGVFDDALCREPLIRELAEEYDVIAYDARGHGRSSAPESGYAMADRVADLDGLIDALAIERPILIGHSMGGDTVAAFAAAHPDRVQGTVMIDPAALLTDDESASTSTAREWILDWHEHTKAELLETNPEITAHVETGDRRLAERLSEARLRVQPVAATVFDAGWLVPRETYSKIRVPALVLKADADEDGRARDRDVAAELPDGRLVHVDGAGHCVFRDEREAATRELRAFLDSL